MDKSIWKVAKIKMKAQGEKCLDIFNVTFMQNSWKIFLMSINKNQQLRYKIPLAEESYEGMTWVRESNKKVRRGKVKENIWEGSQLTASLIPEIEVFSWWRAGNIKILHKLPWRCLLSSWIASITAGSYIFWMNKSRPSGDGLNSETGTHPSSLLESGRQSSTQNTLETTEDLVLNIPSSPNQI